MQTQDYLNWSGDWQAASEDQASGYNEALAEVIAEGVMAEVAKGKTEKEVPDVALRLALVGAPFSGKTTMARKLAEECGCKVNPSSVHHTVNFACMGYLLSCSLTSYPQLSTCNTYDLHSY